VDGGALPEKTARSLHETGSQALQRGDWPAAREAFDALVRLRPSAEAYEGLSWAAWWQNDADALFGARERAFQLYRDAGDALGAARLATWLSTDYNDFRGEAAISNGWLRTAARLLAEKPTATEHAWLAIIEGDTALMADNVELARRKAQEAVAIGRQLHFPDAEIIGLAMEGIALTSEGGFEAGVSLLDEAAARALSGEARELFSVSMVLCYLIYACERARDYDRAAQWCQRAKAYADRLNFTLVQGICRAHYAGVLIWHGKWTDAERELMSATRDFLASRPPLADEANVRLGELRRRQGRWQEAEALFREAEWHPLALIGLSELALDGGRPAEAADLAGRALRSIPESAVTQRAWAHEVTARARAAQGDHVGARQALAAIETAAESLRTPAMRAAALSLSGLLAAARGDDEPALRLLEDAAAFFDKMGAAYEAARVRLEVASLQVRLGRPEAARAAAGAAAAVFRRLGAAADAARLQALGAPLAGRAASPLTERQLDVLRLIARGLSDREVAASLVMSEHTVHRHVANILQRLGQPSRAAAVAHAARLDLL
jgi:LuxR family maltose regulon positive regulatory protein